MEHQANTTPEAVPQRRQHWYIELTVVLVILSVLVAFLLPAVQAAREAARRMQCTAGPKPLALAMHNYHDTHGSLPPAYTVDENGRPLHSWRVLLLPYIEQKELYDKIRLDEPWDSEYNQQFHREQISTFQCPTRRGTLSARGIRNVFVKNRELLHMANCDYSIVVGEGTIFSGSQAIILKDIDSTSNTILIVERMTPVNWMDPNNEVRYEAARDGVNRNLHGIGSEHWTGSVWGKTGGAWVAFADGSLRFLDDDFEDIEPLLTKSAGD